jgi:preprotein translocase subunit SecD
MLDATRVNVNKPMSTVFIETRREPVTVDGEISYRTVRSEEIINTATIRGVFKDRFQTTGLTPVEARDLALLLRAGALAAPVYKVEERTIGPSLGQDNIDRGFNAVTVGFLLCVLFTSIYYRWFGVIASIALFSNLVFIVALLSLLQAPLTPPGIAGIVLTVRGRRRQRADFRAHKKRSTGYSAQATIAAVRCFSSIADSNITTLIAGIKNVWYRVDQGLAALSFGIMTRCLLSLSAHTVIVNSRTADAKCSGFRVVRSCSNWSKTTLISTSSA